MRPEDLHQRLRVLVPQIIAIPKRDVLTRSMGIRTRNMADERRRLSQSTASNEPRHRASHSPGNPAPSDYHPKAHQTASHSSTRVPPNAHYAQSALRRVVQCFPRECLSVPRGATGYNDQLLTGKRSRRNRHLIRTCVRTIMYIGTFGRAFQCRAWQKFSVPTLLASFACFILLPKLATN
jgi:hypothetical protein